MKHAMPRRLRRCIGSLALTAVGLAPLSGLADPLELLPPDEALAEWDARFQPGRYALEEWDVDPTTDRPLAGSIQWTRVCLSKADIRRYSRLPLTTSDAWGCDYARVELDERSFAVGMTACTPAAAGAQPPVGLAAVRLTGRDQFETVLAKLLPAQGDQAARSVIMKKAKAQRLGHCMP